MSEETVAMSDEELIRALEDRAAERELEALQLREQVLRRTSPEQ